MPLFYNQILNLFEDPDDPWVEETLGWWNRLVVHEYGLGIYRDYVDRLNNSHVGIYHEPEHARRSGSDTESDLADDLMDVIRAQRSRRRQASSQNGNQGTSETGPDLSGIDHSIPGINHDPRPQPPHEPEDNGSGDDNIDPNNGNQHADNTAGATGMMPSHNDEPENGLDGDVSYEAHNNEGTHPNDSKTAAAPRKSKARKATTTIAGKKRKRTGK